MGNGTSNIQNYVQEANISNSALKELKDSDINIILIQSNSAEDQILAQNLRTFSQTIQLFPNVESFTKTITTETKGAYFLIVKEISENQVIKIKDQSCIFSILFRICGNPSWTSSYKKIQCIEDSQIQQYFKSVRRILDDDNLKKETPLQFQTLKLSVGNNQSSFNYAKKEFEKFARSYLEERGQQELEKLNLFINEFKDMESLQNNKILLWFIGDSFLNKIVNNTLRKGNLLEIFRIRFVLYTLSKQLREIQLENRNVGNLVLYRGTTITVNQYQSWRNKEDQPIQMLGLVSTSSSQQMALLFMKMAYNRIENQKDYKAVLFEIEVDQDIKYKPIKLKDYDNSVSEYEYLMDLNTVLILTSFQEDKDADFVRLKTKIHRGQNLISQQSEIREQNQEEQGEAQVQQLEHFKIAELFENLGMQNELITLLEELICENPKENAVKYMKLGQAYENKQQLQEALKSYEQAIQIFIEEKDEDNLMICYKLKGSCEYQLNKFENAKQSYEKVIELRNKKKLRNPNSAVCYNDLGVICEKLCLFQEAFKHKQQALDIIENYEGYDELKATIYNNFGIALENMQNFKRGKELKERSLELALKLYGQGDVKTAHSYNNLGISYEYLGEYAKSLEQKLKALKIYESNQNVNPVNLAKIQNNIGIGYDRLGDIPSGEIFKEKAYEIRIDKIKDKDKDLDLLSSFNNLGISYQQNGEFKKSFKFKQYCLDKLLQNQLKENSVNLIFAKNNIGISWQEKSQYSEVAEDEDEDLEQALKMKKEAFQHFENLLAVQDHIIKAHILQSIGHTELIMFHRNYEKIKQRIIDESERQQHERIVNQMYGEENSRNQSQILSESQILEEENNKIQQMQRDRLEREALKQLLIQCKDNFRTSMNMFGKLLGDQHPQTLMAKNYVDVISRFQYEEIG